MKKLKYYILFIYLQNMLKNKNLYKEHLKRTFKNILIFNVNPIFTFK